MARFWLFLTSLAPALLIGSVRSTPEWKLWGWIGVLASIALFLSAYFVLFARRRTEPVPIVPKTVKDESTQIPTYLLTFIFPFLFIGDAPDKATLAAYAIFAAMLLTLLYRTDLSLVNPALLALGYHVYAVEVQGYPDSFLVAKKAPQPEASCRAHSLSGNLYIMSKDEGRE